MGPLKVCREIGGTLVIALTLTSGLDGDKYQPHASADISPKKDPIEYEVGLAPEPVWTFRRREKFLRTPAVYSRSVVTM